MLHLMFCRVVIIFFWLLTFKQNQLRLPAYLFSYQWKSSKFLINSWISFKHRFELFFCFNSILISETVGRWAGRETEARGWYIHLERRGAVLASGVSWASTRRMRASIMKASWKRSTKKCLNASLDQTMAVQIDQMGSKMEKWPVWQRWMYSPLLRYHWRWINCWLMNCCGITSSVWFRKSERLKNTDSVRIFWQRR